ncbi:hypothetical protein ON010_g14748 [Phytophthora cinnamomi]|nr:hypothetical protein ON010_g14748 [Phytophthora cinnamomi]
MSSSSLFNFSSVLKPPASANVLMRLSQVLVVIAASVLVTSEALLTTTDSNQVKTSKVASLGSGQRLLRTHPMVAEDEDDSEERVLSEAQIKAICAKVGISWSDVKYSVSALQNHALYKEYQKEANAILKAQKKKKAPKITYEGRK